MSDKYQMFENRLAKVHKHLAKTARRQGITCFRLYDRDLPEFPLIIELYEDKVSVAEYLSSHGMDDDAYDEWLERSVESVGKVLGVPGKTSSSVPVNAKPTGKANTKNSASRRRRSPCRKTG